GTIGVPHVAAEICLLRGAQALRKGGGLMPEHDSAGDQSSQPVGPEPAEEHARPVVTRRDFIAGAGLGVAATAIVAGGVTVATRKGVQNVPAPQPVAQPRAGGAVIIDPAPYGAGLAEVPETPLGKDAACIAA